MDGSLMYRQTPFDGMKLRVPMGGPQIEKLKFKMISREEWGAKPAEKPLEEPEETPLDTAFLRATNTAKCRTEHECSRLMRQLQEKDMEEGEPDIKYNFYVGGDGNVYEGRGWLAERAQIAPIDLMTFSSICIGLIGTYSMEKKPSKKMMMLVLALIHRGTQLKHLADHTLYKSLNTQQPI